MRINGGDYYYEVDGKSFNTSIDVAMRYLQGKWKFIILFNLKKERLRFSALKAAIPGITDKMLSKELKELEHDGFVERELFAEVPPRVEYFMTFEGKTLLPMLEELEKWGHHKAMRSGAMLPV